MSFLNNASMPTGPDCDMCHCILVSQSTLENLENPSDIASCCQFLPWKTHPMPMSKPATCPYGGRYIGDLDVIESTHDQSLQEPEQKTCPEAAMFRDVQEESTHWEPLCQVNPCYLCSLITRRTKFHLPGRRRGKLLASMESDNLNHEANLWCRSAPSLAGSERGWILLSLGAYLVTAFLTTLDLRSTTSHSRSEFIGHSETYNPYDMFSVWLFLLSLLILNICTRKLQ